MQIRLATASDYNDIWQILEPAIRAGETLALPRSIQMDEALTYWLSLDHETYVAAKGSEVLGTYFLRTNQRGGGDHVANAGYVTASWATGKGVARAMCVHSIERAKARGFRALQFNFVVSTNEPAVHLWESLGFGTVGRLPGAFNHPKQGFVDALVMSLSLKE